MSKSIAIALFAVTVTGCAGMRREAARNKHIEGAVTSFTYQRPCNDVWGAARTMLFTRDFQVKSADAAAGLTLETEWKPLEQGAMVRYLFQGAAPTPEQCQVQATAATKSQQGNTTMSRDWHMEWDLLQQVDIESANRIKADADAAANATK